MKPAILYANPAFLVVNKPSGLLVHGAGGGESVPGEDGRGKGEPTLAAWLAAHYPEVQKVGDDPAERPGIVHRLDRETSGIMIAARTQHAFEYFKRLFQRHEMEKTYWAIVDGVFKDAGGGAGLRGVIDAPIGIKAGGVARTTHGGRMVKEARTEYRVLKQFMLANGAPASLVEATPKTGRTHQIRVHLAHIHHPVIGDPAYGGKRIRALAPRAMLHARALAFTAPDGARMRFEADPPEDFMRIAREELSTMGD